MRSHDENWMISMIKITFQNLYVQVPVEASTDGKQFSCDHDADAC